MKKALLHIGTGKTGSTSIQKSLDDAYREGRLGSISYPRLNNVNHHRDIISLYRGCDRLPRGLKQKYKGNSTAYANYRSRTTEDFLSAARCSTNLIISSEFLTLFDVDEIERLRVDLANAGFDTFMVVVYVREPTSYYLSFVQQTLKASSKFPSPTVFRYKFRDIIRRWDSVFRGCVNVRAFDKSALQGGDVVTDIASVCSNFFQQEIAMNDGVRSNVALSAEAMVVLQEYRRRFHSNEDNVFKSDSNKLIRVIQGATIDIPQNKPILRSDVKQMINANHQQDLASLTSDYGVFLGVSSDSKTESRYNGNYDDIKDILLGIDNEIVTELLWFSIKSCLRDQEQGCEL